MATTGKTKALYAAVVLLVQAYLLYAATLYVEVGSAGFFCVLCAAAASAVGASVYLFVVANDAAEGGGERRFALEERRRIG